MSDGHGPWGSREGEPAPPKARFGAPRFAAPSRGAPRFGRFGLWLLMVLGLLGLVAALAHAFPGEVRDGEDWSRVAYAAGVVLLVATGLFRLRGGPVRQHLKHIAIWAVIIGVAALGFAYRDLIAEAPQRLKLAFSDGAPVVSEHELVVPRDESGAYTIVGAVNGQRVRFVVDTGATATVLSPEDAKRIGVNVDALTFGRAAETANGVGYSAAYVAPSLEIGPIRFADFEMEVNQAPMSTSLLGMTFLHRLDSFEFKGGNLYLRFHEQTR